MKPKKFFCLKLDARTLVCPITEDTFCPNLCDKQPLPFDNKSPDERQKILKEFLENVKVKIAKRDKKSSS